MPRSSKLDLAFVNSHPSSYLTIGTKKHYRGVSPFPGTPVKGDTWEELSATDDWIETWVWNGTYWLSKEKITKELIVPTATATAVAEFCTSSGVNILVKKVRASFLINAAPGGATNYLQWGVIRMSNVNVATNVAITSNQGVASHTANTWARYESDANVHIDVFATNTIALRLSLSRIGATVTAKGAFSFDYHLARLN